MGFNYQQHQITGSPKCYKRDLVFVFAEEKYEFL